MAKKRAEAAGWHRADIVAAVRKSGSSLVRIAAELGLTSSAASRALIKPHSRVNRAIAEVVGASPHEIWPQWFDVDGDRIAGRLSSRSLSVSRSRTARVSESRSAAFSSPENSR